MTDKYSKQDRGDLSDYEAYFAGMDASMQQKIALTTAHFPARGRIADMGSGSGTGTVDLARLYKNLELVGVDINPVTVEYSNEKHRSENLGFIVGDIAERVFEPETLDGILDSSVLHHVTSFNNYDLTQIAKTIRNQVAQLKPGGVLIIRDFVVPDEAERAVCLGLPTDDGSDSGEIAKLSTAALFEVFARDFRSSLNLNESVSYKKTRAPIDNFAFFEVTLRTAVEFVLRKDYRDHWAPELLEEYTYYSQGDFEENFRKENLRIVVSMPLWNPWIVENRFAGKFHLLDRRDQPLSFPPTNFLIVGEKIGKGEGVRLGEKVEEGAVDASGTLALPAFLKMKGYRHKENGRIFELAERPNQTIDLLPWFMAENSQIFILAKKDFPRPIVNAESDRKHLHRANYSGYLTEPISAISDSGFRISDFSEGAEESEPSAVADGSLESPQPSAGAESLDARVRRILRQRANLDAGEVVEISKPQLYFTSPGGIDERVESFLVQIEKWSRPPQMIENYTTFQSAGCVRELDALQVLRASHVGGMFDARLEINIYRLLRKLNRSASSWIGATVNPTVQKLPEDFRIGRIDDFTSENRNAFEPVGKFENKFLKLVRSEFIEFDAENREVGRAEFEYVAPRKFSKNTVAAIPFVKTEDGVLVGIEFRDLPAPQNFTGNSLIPCVPAWRLPKTVGHKFDLENFLRRAFPKDFRAEVNKTWELGGTYFPTPGVTPEIVHPLAVELKTENPHQNGLCFLPLEDLLNRLDQIPDAHLLILANRLGHALGFLSK
ncbi:MAG: methyltransferase domain-containing protein [Pyrinomonadaceae bacterium]